MKSNRRILAYVDRYPERSTADVAFGLGLDRHAVLLELRKLEAQGWVRSRTDGKRRIWRHSQQTLFGDAQAQKCARPGAR